MEMKTIIELCTLNMGQSPNSETYNEHGIGLPFYQGNADFGEIHPNTHIWCSKPVKIANIGDILISVRAPIGALNITDEKCCIGRGLASLTPKYDICDRMYLYYALHSQVDLLIKQGTGSTFKAIGKKVLERTLIPVYSLEKQEQIAKKFDCIDKAINKRKHQILLLDELTRSRFVELFGDILCNDKGWPIYTLDAISSSRLGKMLDAKRNTGKNSFPYLANFNVQWFEFDLSELHEMDFNKADCEEFSLKDGDLLITEGGEVGRCAIWHNEIPNCYFQKALHRVRCNKNIILPEYLAWWFKFHSDFNGFEDIVGGKATIAHLPGVKLKKLQIEVPNIDVQKDFVSFWQEIDKSKFSTLMSHKNIIKMYQSPLKAA